MVEFQNQETETQDKNIISESEEIKKTHKFEHDNFVPPSEEFWKKISQIESILIQKTNKNNKITQLRR